MVRRAGGVPRAGAAGAAALAVRPRDAGGVFSERTRLVVLNNPLNPAATVCPDEDLALLAEFCVRFDAVAVCDEVWEQVVFDGRRPPAADGLPGHARALTVKIGSAGKMFALTGWKVGFLMRRAGPDPGAGQGAPVPDLHHPAQPAGRRGLGPGQQRRLVRRHARRDLAARATG
jgi:N-succinyldiaminopimelate aminotransferase